MAAEVVVAVAEAAAATILTVAVVATITEAGAAVMEEAGPDHQALEATEAIIAAVMDRMWTGSIVKLC